MTLCPVARAVGCQKCPLVSACPLKGVIGDYKAPEQASRNQRRMRRQRTRTSQEGVKASTGDRVHIPGGAAVRRGSPMAGTTPSFFPS
jgi:hypothetical protein